MRFYPHLSRLSAQFICFVFLVVFAVSAQAQGGIPAEELENLKAATALILVDTPEEENSGSGFLIATDESKGYLATNAHVLEVENGQRRRVRVVFNSGIPGKQRVLPAEVVAEDEYRDLAILRVLSVNLPAPLKLSSPQPLRETAQVWVLGFPFGEMMSTSRLHPAMTVTTGTITSLRLNDYGKVTRVQVDADINEGNSGGPIIDSSGGLVGIATEKVDGTKIGLGLPPSELEAMLKGRVRDAGFEIVNNQNGRVEYKSTVRLIDPMQQVRAVGIYFIKRDGVKTILPNENGEYGAAAPQMQEFLLKANGTDFEGSFTLQNPNPTLIDTTYLHQIRITLADGGFKWTQPSDFRVPFSKGNQPATVTPGANGQVQDDWLGGPAVPQPGPNAPLKAIQSGKMLLSEAKTDAGATYRALDIPGKITSTMTWSVDGKSLYLLEASGVLRKIAVPDFREDLVLELGQKADCMALTREGIVVGLPLLQEVWLFNADNLNLLKRIPVGSLKGLAGSPLLSTAYASQNGMLSIIDLKEGKIAIQVKGRRAAIEVTGNDSAFGDCKFVSVSPDGKYLMLASGECIQRFRIDDNQLVFEESGPYIGQNSQRLEISADSRYVALPSGGGNFAPEGHPQVGPYATYVYRITDLKTPVITISSGAYPRALAFDKTAGRIYAQSYNQHLIVFTPTGIKEKSYSLSLKDLGQRRATGSTGETEQFLVHPAGGKVLVLTGSTLFWVEL